MHVCYLGTVSVLKRSVDSIINSYRPVAITPIMMKCFEKLVPQRMLYPESSTQSSQTLILSTQTNLILTLN